VGGVVVKICGVDSRVAEACGVGGGVAEICGRGVSSTGDTQPASRPKIRATAAVIHQRLMEGLKKPNLFKFMLQMCLHPWLSAESNI
jgi:hypothetical protein